MVISSPCRILVFQEISYRRVLCHIVSRVVPISMFHNYLIALEIIVIKIVTEFLNMFSMCIDAMSLACI